MDDGGARFIVFLLRDPHLLEGGEGSQDGTTDPDGVFAFGGSDDLDLHGGWGQSSDVLLHTISDSGVHGGTTGEDAVGVEVLTDINVAPHDGVVGGFSETDGFHSEEGWLEEGFRATEALVSNGDDLTVRKLVGLFERGGGSGGVHFLFEVQGDIAKLFLDVADNFTLGGGGERVAALSQDLHQVVGEIATSQVETLDGMGKGITWCRNDNRMLRLEGEDARIG